MLPHLAVGFTDETFKRALIDIEDKLFTAGGNHFSFYGLPKVNRMSSHKLQTDVIQEIAYGVNAF